MKLKNGLRVLWLGENQAQIGSDPLVTQRFQLEHPAEYEVLQLLETGRAASNLRAELARRGGRAERVDALLRELADASMLDHARPARSPGMQIVPSMREVVAAEAESRCLLDSNCWRVMTRRASQSVVVYGLGRTGAHIALGLAAAGLGRLLLRDDRPVAPHDRGQVFTRAHVGMPRAEAVAALIQEKDLDCKVQLSGRAPRPHAAVMVDYEVTDPVRVSNLVDQGIPHLPVVVGELRISCGPWVPRRVGPCVKCQHLFAADQDPLWPKLATQRSVRSAVAQRGEDPSLAAMVGGLAVGQVLQALSGGHPFTIGREIEVHLPSYSLRWRDLDSHPRCDGHRPRVRRRPPCPPPMIPLPPPM
jgi:hypothetical protein